MAQHPTRPAASVPPGGAGAGARPAWRPQAQRAGGPLFPPGQLPAVFPALPPRMSPRASRCSLRSPGSCREAGGATFQGVAERWSGGGGTSCRVAGLPWVTGPSGTRGQGQGWKQSSPGPRVRTERRVSGGPAGLGHRTVTCRLRALPRGARGPQGVRPGLGWGG